MINFSNYTINEEDVEITDTHIVLPTEAIRMAISRGAHQFKLWLSETDKCIYTPVNVVTSYAKFDLGKYFVPLSFWVSE